MKQEWLRRIQIPLPRNTMRREMEFYLEWYAVHRPHQCLGGKSPGGIYDGKDKGQPRGAEAFWDSKHPLDLVVEFHKGRRQLPIVRLREKAA